MTRSHSISASLLPCTSTGMQSSPLKDNAADFCTTAELLVGPKPTRFLIHTSLLTSQSPYFRAALTGSFLESTSQSIRLEDVAVDLFELCVGWLYTGDIHPVPFKDGKPAYYTLLHLYILADRFCFEGLRNRIVDLMADLADSTNSVLTPSDTRILYDLVVDGAMIKKLVLDLFAFKKTDKLLAEHGDRWHAGFLRDLCVHLKRPCEQAMQRHKLAMWYPEHDKGLLGPACENCRCVMTPRHGAVRCEGCGLVWCVNCVGDGVGLAAWEDGRSVFWNIARQARGDTEGGDEGRVLDGAIGRKMGARKWVACKSWNGPACKPWNGARCAVYHEHKETEKCEDVFMGP